MPNLGEIKSGIGARLPGGGGSSSSSSGKREGLRSKAMNQVTSRTGIGNKDKREDPHDHVSTPITSLKDPSSFAPPPKHINYHGAAAVPNTTTPDRGGWGAPLPADTVRQQEQARNAEVREAEKPPPPPRAYRKDTTGLSTANLPPPPVRRVGDGVTSPPPPAPPATKKPTPGLPPRLPARQNSNPGEFTPAPPPTYNEATNKSPASYAPNQGAMSRLGQAGVSVPGFGIGRPETPPRSPQSTGGGSVSAAQPAPSQLGELQSRFAKMSASPAQTEGSTQGTSFAQKQAALGTLRSAQRDPSSVSFSDARSAASTANNFRQRHGDQVASGLQTANGLGQRFGVTTAAAGQQNTVPDVASAAAKKGPPPPPPAKKSSLISSHADNAGAPVPPPLPLSSKPRPT